MRGMFVLLTTAAIIAFSGCDRRDSNASFNRSEEGIVLNTDWPLTPEEAKQLQAHEAEQLGLPVEKKIELGAEVPAIELVFIPPGTFPMGKEGEFGNPPRLVKLTRGFYMSRYEITWGQLLAVVNQNAIPLAGREITADIREQGYSNYPAKVDWNLAQHFCEQLSKSHQITARLPTEAEWEYACRAGTTQNYGEWDMIDDSKARVGSWIDASSENELGIVYADKDVWSGPGGLHNPNRWGLHDMIGNVAEWCLDDYKDPRRVTEYPTVDPLLRGLQGPLSGIFKVVRGGSYLRAKSVYERDGDARGATGMSTHIGVRLVVERP